MLCSGKPTWSRNVCRVWILFDLLCLIRIHRWTRSQAKQKNCILNLEDGRLRHSLLAQQIQGYPKIACWTATPTFLLSQSAGLLAWRFGIFHLGQPFHLILMLAPKMSQVIQRSTRRLHHRGRMNGPMPHHPKRLTWSNPFSSPKWNPAQPETHHD